MPARANKVNKMAVKDIRKLAVIGSGFMGGGIAQVAAMAGLDVIIQDTKPGACAKTVENINWSLNKLKSKGKFAGDPEEVMKRLHPVDKLEKLTDQDMIIEAIYEVIPAKQELLQALTQIVSRETIVASNTSSIPMNLLSEKVPNPARFIGTHFFGPVPLMGLVEIVMGTATSEETLEIAKSLVKKLGKTPVVIRKPSPGFLVNRIFNAAAGEAIRCWLEGVATPQDIDTGMRLGYGWAAGPFEVFDNAGLDVMAGIFTVMGGGLPPQLKEMLDKGHLGKKTGQGFYKYGPDGKKIS